MGILVSKVEQVIYELYNFLLFDLLEALMIVLLKPRHFLSYADYSHENYFIVIIFIIVIS